MDLDKSSIAYKEAGFLSASIENVEEEANIVSPPWSELPPHIIEKIYSFLDRHNQSKMSLVCRSWANEYGSPSLWRSMKFYLRKCENNMDIDPEVRLVKKYGAMLQHVVINCDCDDHDLDFVMWKQLLFLLISLMRNSQLLSLTLIDNNFLFECQDNKFMFDSLFGVIKNLILSQKKLQSLDLRNLFLKPSDAVDLLRILCTKITLKDLSLPGFVKELTHDEVLENTFVDGSYLENLMNLEMWTFDYSRFFENIMTKFYEYGSQPCMTKKKWNLQIMYLHCYAYETFKGISSSVWKYIRKVCPQLEIYLFFEIEMDPNELGAFVTRFMPITSIVFFWTGGEDYVPDIGPALQHLVLCGINKNLEELCLKCAFGNTDLASELKNFLQVSPKLRILILSMEDRIEGFHALFNDWLENRPMSLETVHITLNVMEGRCTNMDIDYLKNFKNLEKEFAPALKKFGLNLILKIN